MTLKDVKAVLEMLRSHAGFEVLLIKSRLMLAFDASECSLGVFREE